jgi:hypothetical protein
LIFAISASFFSSLSSVVIKKSAFPSIGKTHNVAVRALAFKWLRILYRCWMDRKPRDEALYIKALQKRGSPLLAAIAGPTAAVQ